MASSIPNPSNKNEYVGNQNANTTSTLFEEVDEPIAIQD